MSSGISSKPEQAGHGNHFLSFSTVFNNYFLPNSLNDLMDTSEIEQETYSILKGDIFLTRTSEVVDELGMSSVALKDYPKATYSGFLKRLRPTQTDVTYHKYMAFYLRSKLFRKTMTNNAVLTLRASLNENIFSYLELILPEYNQQVKSGDLLYLINSKIELNNRINAELENLAKTIYDYWFVQFDYPNADGKPYKSSGGEMVCVEGGGDRVIPAGWELKRLSCFCNKIGDGIHGTPKYVDSSSYYFINGNNLKNGFIEIGHDTKNVSSDEYEKYYTELNEETILLSINGTLGNLAIYTGEKVMLGKSAAYINCKNKYRPYCYQFLKLEHIQKKLWNIATGSTIKNLSLESLKNISVLFPNTNLIERYYELTEPLDKKRKNIFRENQQLTQLRDWLLPMLMNGQISIK